MSDVHTESSAQLTVGPHALLMRGLHKTYLAGIPGCTARASVLCGINLAVRRGEIVGVAGGVGAGKSTLLLCAAGLLRPDAGSVTILGHPAASEGSPLITYVSLAHAPGQRCNPTQALARALSTGAPVLLLDGLLPHLSPGACKLIGALASRGMTIIAAERDRTLLEPLVERTLVLYEGVLWTRVRGTRRPHSSHRRAATTGITSPARVAEHVVPGRFSCRA